MTDRSKSKKDISGTALFRYMETMENDPESKTYKIGQAADLLGVKPFVLRFWESEFPQLEPVRTASGQRLYTEAHVAIVREIKRLLYDEGLTIEGARKRLEDKGGSTILFEIRRELLDIRDMLVGRRAETEEKA